MTNDFHFDTEIIMTPPPKILLREVPVPTYYGTEICRVNGIKYAKDVHQSIVRYRQTCRSIRRHPEFAEYFVQYPIKHSRFSSHDYARQMAGAGREVLDLGCGNGFFAFELSKEGNRVTGVDLVEEPTHRAALEEYIHADLSNGITRRLRS